MMTAPTQLNKALPYIFGVLSFLGGFAVSYVGYTNKVDSLTNAVATLTKTVNEQSNKIDGWNEKYNSLDKRTSKIEFYLFEYKKPVQSPE